MLSKSILYLSALFISLGCVQGDVVELHGRISMKGSSPHSYLAIYDKVTAKLYKIQNTKKYNVDTYQNKTITLKVKVVQEEVGIGFPAVVEVLEIKK